MRKLDEPIIVGTEHERLGLQLRRVFETQDGKVLLAWLLRESGYWEKIETSEQCAVRNFIIELLDVTGSLDPRNERRLVEDMARLPMRAVAVNNDQEDKDGIT